MEARNVMLMKATANALHAWRISSARFNGVLDLDVSAGWYQVQHCDLSWHDYSYGEYLAWQSLGAPVRILSL